MSKITFNDNFNSVDRIGGSDDKIEELGIEVLGEKSKESYMWDYECVDIDMKTKTFSDVDIDWNDEKDCCDICFSNGVCFGYVEDTDFSVIEE